MTKTKMAREKVKLLRRNKYLLYNSTVWSHYELSMIPLILRCISVDATRILKSYLNYLEQVTIETESRRNELQ